MGAVHPVPGLPAGDPQDRLHDERDREPELPVPPGCPPTGAFPDGLSALKVLYLVIRTPHHNRLNVTGQTPGWKEAINALTMYYGDRITLN